MRRSPLFLCLHGTSSGFLTLRSELNQPLKVPCKQEGAPLPLTVGHFAHSHSIITQITAYNAISLRCEIGKLQEPSRNSLSLSRTRKDGADSRGSRVQGVCAASRGQLAISPARCDQYENNSYFSPERPLPANDTVRFQKRV